MCVSGYRLGVQYGYRVPVPQLASICTGCGSSCCCLFGWAHLHAREPPLPPGGETASILTPDICCNRFYIISAFRANYWIRDL